MNDPRGSFLDALFHDLATMFGVGQTGCEDLPQRRVGAQLLELLVIEFFLFDPLPYLTEQVGWSDAARPQRPQAFGNDAGRSDRTQNDGSIIQPPALTSSHTVADPLHKSGATLA